MPERLQLLFETEPRYALSGACLRKASFYFADLSGADLHGADLRSADLRHAKLVGTVLSSADLRGANLRGATISKADVRYADFRGAILCGCFFGKSDLLDARFSNADLRGADLRFLEAADQDGEPLADFTNARYSDSTKLPYECCLNALGARRVDASRRRS